MQSIVLERRPLAWWHWFIILVHVIEMRVRVIRNVHGTAYNYISAIICKQAALSIQVFSSLCRHSCRVQKMKESKNSNYYLNSCMMTALLPYSFLYHAHTHLSVSLYFLISRSCFHLLCFAFLPYILSLLPFSVLLSDSISFHSLPLPPSLPCLTIIYSLAPLSLPSPFSVLPSCPTSSPCLLSSLLSSLCWSLQTQ